MSYKSIGFAKFCLLLSTRHLIVLLDFLMETDDAEMLTSEMHDPYTRTTGA